MNYSNQEHQRRTHNLLSLATVKEIDWQKRQFRAQKGNITTGWLPFPADISNNYRRHLPLRLGAQILLGSPSGDLNNACAVGMLWQDAINSPDDDIPTNERGNIDRVQFNDGTRIEYDSSGQTLSVFCVGDIRIRAQGNIYLDGAKIYLNSGE